MYRVLILVLLHHALYCTSGGMRPCPSRTTPNKQEAGGSLRAPRKGKTHALLLHGIRLDSSRPCTVTSEFHRLIVA